MDLNRIVTMVLRMIVRRIVGRGVNAGFKAVEQRSGKARQAVDTSPAPEHVQTPNRGRRLRRTHRKSRRM